MEDITIPSGYDAKIEGDKVVFFKKESEDERIRKEIVKYLTNEVNGKKQVTPRTNEFDAWMRYLERQKEYKSIKFPDVSGVSEDELIDEYSSVLYKTIRHYIDKCVDFTDFNVRADAQMNFFCLRMRLSKALEKRYNDGYQEGVASSKSAEWSEEDERMLERVVDTIGDSILKCDCDDTGVKARFALIEERKWLKSLPERFK